MTDPSSNGSLNDAICDLENYDRRDKKRLTAWARSWANACPDHKATILLLARMFKEGAALDSFQSPNQAPTSNNPSKSSFISTSVATALAACVIAPLLYGIWFYPQLVFTIEQRLFFTVFVASPVGIIIALRSMRYWLSTLLINSGIGLLYSQKISFNFSLLWNSGKTNSDTPALIDSAKLIEQACHATENSNANLDIGTELNMYDILAMSPGIILIYWGIQLYREVAGLKADKQTVT